MEASTIYIVGGPLDDHAFSKVKKHLINPVEASEVPLKTPDKLGQAAPIPEKTPVYEEFIDWDIEAVKKFRGEKGYAMSVEDLLHCQKYFK